MRVTDITLGGKVYPACFSLRVINACSERFGGVDGLEAALTPGKDGDPMTVLNNCVWLLARMMQAGKRKAEMDGNPDTPEPPTADYMLDAFGLDDLAMLQGSVMQTVAGSQERTVEVEPEKNGETARETPEL